MWALWLNANDLLSASEFVLGQSVGLRFPGLIASLLRRKLDITTVGTFIHGHKTY